MMDCSFPRSRRLVGINGATCVVFTPGTASLHGFAYLIY